MSLIDLSSSPIFDERFRFELLEEDLSFLDDDEEVVLPLFPELRPDEDLFDDPEEPPLFEVFPFISLVFNLSSRSMPASADYYSRKPRRSIEYKFLYENHLLNTMCCCGMNVKT